MDQQKRKILAREFLFFTSTIGISVTAIFFSFIFSLKVGEQISRLKIAIKSTEAMSDSLSNFYKNKNENREYYYLELEKEYGDIYDSKEELFIRLSEIVEHDSVEILWNEVWDSRLKEFNKEYGLSSPELFIHFVHSSTINAKDISDYNESIRLRGDLDSLKNEISILEIKKSISSKYGKVWVGSFSISFAILFLCRYFFYGLRWSLKVIKEKS